MTTFAIVTVLLLSAVELLASYISRIYSEFGKILSHEVQENLDAWEEKIEPHLGLTREHAAICAAVMQQLALGAIALAFGVMLFDHTSQLAWPSYAEVAQAVIGIVLVVVFCNQIFPSLLFNRTRGRLGNQAALAHPPAALAHDPHHGFCALLFLRGISRRGANHARGGIRR